MYAVLRSVPGWCRACGVEPKSRPGGLGFVSLVPKESGARVSSTGTGNASLCGGSFFCVCVT